MAQRSDERIKYIDASLERVFDAISDPTKLARWWGPAGFSNTFHEYNFSTGGFWRLTMHGPDGKNYANENQFIEIQQNKKVVIEHHFTPHFFLSIDLTHTNNKTRIDWRQLFDTPEEYQKLAHIIGPANQQNLDKLEQVVLG